MKKSVDVVATLLFLSGLATIFVVERNFSTSVNILILRGISAVLVTAPIIGQWINRVKTQKRSGFSYTIAWKLAVLSGVLVWAIWNYRTSILSTPDMTNRILLGVCIVLITTGLVSGTGIEWASWQGSSTGDTSRVEKAGRAWFATGLLLCSLGAINFAAVKRDISRDWSYLKVTQPSQATIDLVRNTNQTIDAGVFIPRDNEVMPWVESYLKQLQAQVPDKMTLTITDKDLDPGAAEKFQTSRNGVIIFQVGPRTERIDLGPTLVAARPILKKLDSEIARLLSLLTTPEKVAYVMRGHGELKPDLVKEESLLMSSKLIEGFLRDQNWSVKTLGLNEGSATQIPADATAVFVLGPTKDLMKEEVSTLDRFLAAGGAAFVALEPGKNTGSVTDWLDTMGIRYEQAPLANERNHVAASRTPVDNWFLFTSSFKNHESVKTLARNDDKAAFLFFESGSFNIEPASNAWKVTETVRSIADTFRDRNKNFQIDAKDESRGVFPVALAATRPVPPREDGSNALPGEARLVVLADSSAISDALIKNQANLVYVADTLKWLAKEPVSGSGAAVEEDIKIRRTNSQDLIWFYGSVILVPLGVLAAGGLMIRSNRRLRNLGNPKKPEDQKTDSPQELT